MTSLSDQYRRKCQELGVKCNSGLVQSLPTSLPELRDLDLQGNVIGPRGLLALLDVITRAPHLSSINLRGNNLNSGCIKDLCGALLNHSAIRSINLSDNDIRLAGPDLVDLLKRNTFIETLGVENTYLRPLFLKLIEIQLRRNKSHDAAASRRPVVPAAAIRPAASADTHKPSPAAPPTAAVAPAATKTPPKAESPPPPQDPFGAFSFGGGEDGTASPPASASEFVAFGSDADADGPSRHAFVTDKVEVMTSASEMEGVVFKKTTARRPTVSAEVYTEDEVSNFKPQVIPKEEAVRIKLMKALEKNNLFSHLEDFELFVAVDQMQDSTRLPGDSIYDEGDEEGDTFYVLYSGTVELQKDGKVVQTLQAGDTFADVMLLYSQSYEHTAVCTSNVTLYSLFRTAYKFILTQSSKKKRAKYEGFLSSIGFLKGLTKQELLQCADALKSSSFEQGGYMITYGEVGEHFYIVVEGTVEVIGRDEQGKPKWVCDFTVGDCVGELEFINNHKCVADVKAKTFVRVAKMNRHHFEMVMGPVKDVLSRIASESTVYEYYRATLAAMKDKDH